MRPRSVAILIILFLTLLLAALNWTAFSTPTLLSLAVTEVYAPIGVLLLVVVGGLSVFYILLLARAESVALIEARRASKEVEKARKLAETGEESRLKEIRQLLADELDHLHAKLDAVLGQQEQEELSDMLRRESEQVVERVDLAEKELRRDIREASDPDAAEASDPDGEA